MNTQCFCVISLTYRYTIPEEGVASRKSHKLCGSALMLLLNVHCAKNYLMGWITWGLCKNTDFRALPKAYWSYWCGEPQSEFLNNPSRWFSCTLNSGDHCTILWWRLALKTLGSLSLPSPSDSELWHLRLTFFFPLFIQIEPIFPISKSSGDCFNKMATLLIKEKWESCCQLP